jgi:hypothetical protein
LLEIFCVYTEISEQILVFLQHFQQALLADFAGQRHTFEGSSCMQHLGGFPSTLLDLGDISPLFSFISCKFLKFF